MHRMLIIIAVVVFSFMLGCQDEMEPREEFWEPSSEQIEKAEVVAQKFAETELNVPKDIRKRAKSHSIGFYEDGRKIISIAFFDPEHFPNCENLVRVLGGFPHYYTISIDSMKMKVVDSYACNE